MVWDIAATQLIGVVIPRDVKLFSVRLGSEAWCKPKRFGGSARRGNVRRSHSLVLADSGLGIRLIVLRWEASQPSRR